jgi:hypothetical protein
MTANATLFNFDPQLPPQKVQIPHREKCERIRCRDPAQEQSVPIGPAVITNYKLVVITVNEAFAKNPERVALLLTSNGSEEKTATEYYLRRYLS